MENNWEPRVGQKVVAIKDQIDGCFKKDQIFIVKATSCCAKCKVWCIDIGMRGPFEAVYTDNCTCGNIILMRNQQVIEWFGSRLFAPINEYPDQTAEIAQQFKEHPDTVDQPVKVLETSN